MTDTRTIAEIFDVLREADAVGLERYDEVTRPLSGTHDFYRMWTEISVDDVDSYRKALEDYTSAKSKPYDTKKCWVEDPMVNGSVVKGKFRNAGVIQKRTETSELTNFIQFLRKGFVQNVVRGTTLILDEARIKEMISTPADDTGTAGTEDYMTVFIPGVDPTRISAIETQVQSIYRAEAAITIGSQNFGNMYILNYQLKEEEDGSYTLFMYLANPRYTLTGFRDWNTRRAGSVTYHYNVPKVLAQEVLTAARGTELSGYVQSYDESKGLVDLVIESNNVEALTVDNQYEASCRYTKREIKAYRLTEAQKDFLIDSWNVAVAGRIVEIDVEEEGEFWSVQISIVYTIKFHVDRYTNVDSFAEKGETEQFLGYKGEEIPAKPVKSKGSIVIRQKRKLDSCAWDVTDQYKTQYPRTTDSKEVTATYSEVFEEKTAQNAAAALKNSAGPNKRFLVRRQQDEFDQVTNRIVEGTWVEASSDSEEISAGHKTLTTESINASEKSAIEQQGKIVVAENRPNEHGTNTSREVVRENLRQVHVSHVTKESYGQRTETDAVSSEYFGVASPDATTGFDGDNKFIELVRAQMADDGKISWVRERHIKKKIDAAAEYDSFDSETRHEVTTESIGQAAASGKVIELTATAGQSKRAAVRYDSEFNTLDVTEQQRDDKIHEVPETGDVLVFDGYLEKRYQSIKRGLKPSELKNAQPDVSANISVDPETGSAIWAQLRSVPQLKSKETVDVKRGDGLTVTNDRIYNQNYISDIGKPRDHEIKRNVGVSLDSLTGKWSFTEQTEEADPGRVEFTIGDNDYLLAWNQLEATFKSDCADYERVLNLNFTQYGDYSYMLSRLAIPEGETEDDWSQADAVTNYVVEYDYRRIPYIATFETDWALSPDTKYDPSAPYMVRNVDEVFTRVYWVTMKRFSSREAAETFLQSRSESDGGVSDDYRTRIETVSEKDHKYIAYKWNQLNPDTWEWEPINTVWDESA